MELASRGSSLIEWLGKPMSDRAFVLTLLVFLAPCDPVAAVSFSFFVILRSRLKN